MKDGQNSQSGSPPSTTGQGGKMQPPANQDIGNAQPSTGNSPTQKMDQGNSNMNENSAAGGQRK
jgi:hypothetical protein